MLSNEARKALARNAVAVAGDRLKIIVHVGHTCTDDAVELQLNLVDHATTLSQPMTIELGYIVTPVKPPPPRYRNWRVYTPREVQWRDGKLVNALIHAGPECSQQFKVVYRNRVKMLNVHGNDSIEILMKDFKE